MQHRILVLRPYGPRIRDRMFAALDVLNLRPGEEDVVANDLSDGEVIEQLRDKKSDVLLCPFNNIKTAEGGTTNGLRLAQQVEEELPQFADTPILMPVSVFSAAVLHFQLSRGTDLGQVSDSLRQRLLQIEENELDEPNVLADRIRDHLPTNRT